jgi:hypothetical protein
MERRTQETEIAYLKEQILALENPIQPLSKMSCSQEQPIRSRDHQQPSTSGNTSKQGNIWKIFHLSNTLSLLFIKKVILIFLDHVSSSSSDTEPMDYERKATKRRKNSSSSEDNRSKKKGFQTDREELASKFAFAKKKSTKGKGVHPIIFRSTQ